MIIMPWPHKSYESSCHTLNSHERRTCSTKKAGRRLPDRLYIWFVLSSIFFDTVQSLMLPNVAGASRRSAKHRGTGRQRLQRASIGRSHTCENDESAKDGSLTHSSHKLGRAAAEGRETQQTHLYNVLNRAPQMGTKPPTEVDTLHTQGHRGHEVHRKEGVGF